MVVLSMDDLIIEALEKNKGIGSTKKILEEVYRDELREINKKLNDEFTEEKEKKRLKREKEKYQRRLLYHLNKLEKEGKIREIGKTDTGEKIFELKETKQLKKTKKHVIPLIEKYKEKGVVSIYSEEDWLERVNTVIVDARKIEKNDYLKVLKLITPLVNDTIGTFNGEEIFNTSNEKIINLLRELYQLTQVYDRKISIEIDTKELDLNKFIKIIDYISDHNIQDIELIFNIDKTKIDHYTEYFYEWVREAKGKPQRLNLHFTNGEYKPLIIGKAGVYTVRKKVLEPLLIVSGLTIGIDLCKLSEQIDVYSSFRKIVDLSVKTIINASIKQAEIYNSFYNLPIISNIIDDANITRALDHYIRIWNYDWKKLEQSYLLELLRNTKRETDSFTRFQEILLSSAGLPQRVGIVFNSAFDTFKGKLSKRVYTKKSLYSIKDLMEGEIKKMIIVKEKLSNIFGMPDRIRINRGGDPKGEEITQEILYIANTTNIKLLTIDLAKRKGEVSLKQFFR